MLNVYRATDLMFPGEYELEEARSFSRKVLEKVVPKEIGDDDHFTKSSNLQRMVFDSPPIQFILNIFISYYEIINNHL